MTDILDDVFGPDIPADEGIVSEATRTSQTRFEAARGRIRGGAVIVFSVNGALEAVRIEPND